MSPHAPHHRTNLDMTGLVVRRHLSFLFNIDHGTSGLLGIEECREKKKSLSLFNLLTRLRRVVILCFAIISGRKDLGYVGDNSMALAWKE